MILRIPSQRAIGGPLERLFEDLQRIIELQRMTDGTNAKRWSLDEESGFFACADTGKPRGSSGAFGISSGP